MTHSNHSSQTTNPTEKSAESLALTQLHATAMRFNRLTHSKLTSLAIFSLIYVLLEAARQIAGGLSLSELATSLIIYVLALLCVVFIYNRALNSLKRDFNTYSQCFVDACQNNGKTINPDDLHLKDLAQFARQNAAPKQDL